MWQERLTGGRQHQPSVCSQELLELFSAFLQILLTFPSSFPQPKKYFQLPHTPRHNAHNARHTTLYTDKNVHACQGKPHSSIEIIQGAKKERGELKPQRRHQLTKEDLNKKAQKPAAPNTHYPTTLPALMLTTQSA